MTKSFTILKPQRECELCNAYFPHLQPPTNNSSVTMTLKKEKASWPLNPRVGSALIRVSHCPSQAALLLGGNLADVLSKCPAITGATAFPIVSVVEGE